MSQLRQEKRINVKQHYSSKYTSLVIFSFWFGCVHLSTFPSYVASSFVSSGYSSCPNLLSPVRSNEIFRSKDCPYHVRKGDISMAQQSSPLDESMSGLVNTLALYDDAWRKNKRDSDRWEKLEIVSSDGNDETLTQDVYLLRQPENFLVPTSVVFFIGGAALGQYPHIAYSAMLTKLSNSVGCAVLAAPYATGLNHFEIAKETGELFRKGLRKCECDLGWKEDLPLYTVAHSLGCKLSLINIAATGISEDLSGIGLISYNNFGFAQSVGMARSFIQSIQSNGIKEGPGSDAMMDTLFGFVEQFTQGIGLEFEPAPEIMDRLVSTKVTNMNEKIRLFCFSDDGLDCSKQLLDCIAVKNENMKSLPSVSGLEGTHLSPVYLNLDLEGIYGLSDEAKQIAGQVVGVQAASFGSEDEVNALVREIASWMTGKEPSQGPPWTSSKENVLKGRY